MPNFYEFFAGGGMARAGLGEHWECLFANDFDPMKSETYATNWGAKHLVCKDVCKLSVRDIPDRADLCWASFPCQDLSLAGNGAGMGRAGAPSTTRSGTFWPFWRLMSNLIDAGRAPRSFVIENVLGALKSTGGKDFVAICDTLTSSGYRVGAVIMDASLFVPQSRPRVFFIAIDASEEIPTELMLAAPSGNWHSKSLVQAFEQLPVTTKKSWVWWNIPIPKTRSKSLIDVLEEHPSSVPWHDKNETTKLLNLMTPINLAKVDAAKATGVRMVGSVYKRTRPDKDGNRCQRAEVRFDGIAGCLRTPGGGSSRQIIILVENDVVRSRLLSSREAARLMGLSDEYHLPERYNNAYHVVGDGLCVPVVRHLAQYLLEPLLFNQLATQRLLAAE